MEKFYIDKGMIENAAPKKAGKRRTLTAMEFTLCMDRDMNREEHYISPGGYILNGKEFNFMDSEGWIDEEDRSKVHFVVRNFDTDSYETSVCPSDTRGEFGEFYVYTGETDEPEVNAIAVEDLIFYFGDKEIRCPKKALRSANKCREEAA